MARNLIPRNLRAKAVANFLNQGMSWRQIASMFGCTPPIARYWLRKGCPIFDMSTAFQPERSGPLWIDPDRNVRARIIARLRNQGVTYTEIGRLFGRPHQTVMYWHQAGCPIFDTVTPFRRPRPDWSRIDDDLMHEILVGRGEIERADQRRLSTSSMRPSAQ